tara:strand:- start:13799 stop:14161 length:363 start_codon:yes stop_codon:yes gene_type:complete
MANITQPYETAKAVQGLLETGSTECTIVVPLDAWFGLEAINAPVDFHCWGMMGDNEMVVISANEELVAWEQSGAMDDIYMANEVRVEKSAGSKMAISFGMSRGKTSAQVKAAWMATYRPR